MTSHATFLERQRQRALDHAPSQDLDEPQLCAELATIPLAALRAAAIRWSAPRGRTREQVIDGIVVALHNPHINRGDTYRIALGHIRACEVTLIALQVKRAG